MRSDERCPCGTGFQPVLAVIEDSGMARRSTIASHSHGLEARATRNLQCVMAVLAVAVLLIAVPLRAQTTLKVIQGWGGKQRAGRWNPVLVRTADETPRNVRLQLISPGPAGFATVIEQVFGVGPTPATHELLTSLHPTSWQRTVAVLRDADTGKLLAQYPQRIREAGPQIPEVGEAQLFIGMSGRPALLEQATRILGGQVGYLPEPEVPSAALGFDALDVLFLNQVDLLQLDAGQQRAILDWVRAGGSLLLVPGEVTIPGDSILGAALPCHVGGVRALALGAEALRRGAIASASKIHFDRELHPSPDARALELIKGSGVVAYWAHRGLGRIMVVPIDVDAVEFESSREREGTLAFWQPIVQTLIPQTRPAEKLKYEAPYYGYQSETREQQREGTAIATACDFLLPAPARPVRWRTLALAAMAILLVIGPLDSIVLKAAGRPHLTWTTIPGWLGLLALAAAWASTAIGAAGPVTVRTLRVVDQVDAQTVASTALLAADSARRTNLAVENATDWWEAAVPGSVDPARPPVQTDLHLHQSETYCTPEQVTVNSGRPRFLRSQVVEAGPPAIGASLLLSMAAGDSPHLTGAIRNLSSQALKNLHIRTALGVVDVPLGSPGHLQPQQEIRVDVAAKGQAFSTASFEARYQNYGYFGNRTYATALNEQDLWAVVPDLAGRRSMQIDQIISSDPDSACIYAQVVDPADDLHLKANADVKAGQFEWLRALVRLGK